MCFCARLELVFSTLERERIHAMDTSARVVSLSILKKKAGGKIRRGGPFYVTLLVIRPVLLGGDFQC